MQIYKSGPAPYDKFMQEAYNDFLYKGLYDKAEACREEAEENHVIVFCENCSGKGEVETDYGYRPCHCVLGQKVEEEDFTNANDNAYGV